MDIIDRAVYELGDHKAPEPIEGAELPKTAARMSIARRGSARGRSALDEVRRRPSRAATRDRRTSIRTTERVRLSLSRWQSVGAIIVVLAIAIGATGVAAYGWVVAHDWGCRVGVIKSYCPPHRRRPATRPPRTDIPA